MRNVFLILCLLAWGCRPANEPAGAETTFYHWKSHLDLSQVERDALARLGSQRLYLRFFDVDIDPKTKAPGPVAKLKVDAAPPAGIEIVPCVFITNRTLRSLNPSQVEDLANKMHASISQTRSKFPGHPVKEVQIDCDWTLQTQRAYFNLLEQLSSHFYEDSIFLSATIRLHQYKLFEQTGIPPVKKGMLMAYNLGNVRDPREENSIFSMTDLQKYLLPPTQYPLELDLALPIFSWTVLIRRGRPIRLLNNLRLKKVLANPRILPKGKSGAIVQESHYFQGHYLYKGDVLRTETVSQPILNEACKLLSEALPQAPANLVFYHLDEQNLDDYSPQQLQKLSGHFH